MFISAQYLFGAAIFYALSLIVYRGNFAVFSDNFLLIQYMYLHIYMLDILLCF